MKLLLNTEAAPMAVRLHFGVKGEIEANVIRHTRSGKLASVDIHGVVTKCGMPYFHNLECLVMEAEAELAAEEKLEEDLLIALIQLRERVS